MSALDYDPKVNAVALANAKAVGKRVSPSLMRNLFDRATAEKDPYRKVVWIRKVGAELTKAVGKNCACKPGCDQCCHIDVLVTLDEARAIERDTGRKMKMPKEWHETPQDSRFFGTPCPFLKNSKCSIYEKRPFACRVYFNMGPSADLCKTDAVRKVPNLDVMAYSINMGLALGPRRALMMADIREFFGGDEC